MIGSHVAHPGWQLARRGLVMLVSPGVRASLRVDHRERLPPRGSPRILVCNHLAYIDTVRLAVVLPPFVLFGPKPRWFGTSSRRALMALLQAVPITDREAFLADGRTLLGRGLTLLHYPEVGRYPEGLGPLVPWALELAREAEVAVQPLAFVTPRHLVVGEPWHPRSATVAELRDALVALGAPYASSSSGVPGTSR